MQARDPKAERPIVTAASVRRPSPTARSGLAPAPAVRPQPRPIQFPRPGRPGTALPHPVPPGSRREETAHYPALPCQRSGFGLPNLRRNVCPHFYMTGSRGAIPIQAPHLLKALIRQEMNVSRCQLRGGVHLEQGYVNDVCLTPRFNQCVFYEDDLTKG